MSLPTTRRGSHAYDHRIYWHVGRASAHEAFAYRLLSPATIETGKTYPVVLFLHGAGERGANNKAQLKYFPVWMASTEMRERFPCFVIAPQCREGTAWSDGDWGSSDSSALPEEPTNQLRWASGILDTLLATLPIDVSRVYLTGLSMGGYGAWELAVRQPERYAAVVPICGGGDESQAARLATLPIWAWHGDADDVVPVVRSRRMIHAITKAGGSPRYTELAGVGHDSWTPAYTSADGAIPWMFEQVRKEPDRLV